MREIECANPDEIIQRSYLKCRIVYFHAYSMRFVLIAQ